jgi:ankyrin repeat protein
MSATTKHVAATNDFCCAMHSSSQSTNVHQSLDELDFARGLWQAAINNDVDRVSKLLEKRDVDESDSSGLTALHYSSRLGHQRVVDLLIAEKANVDVVSKAGLTPLMLAATQGHTGVVRSLLSAKSCAKFSNSRSQTARQNALLNGHFEIVALIDSFHRSAQENER